MTVDMGLVVGHGRRDNGNWDPGSVGHDGRHEHSEALEVAIECAEGLRRSNVSFISEVEAAAKQQDPNFQGSSRWINRHVDGDGLALSLHFDYRGAGRGGFGIHMGSTKGKRAAEILGSVYGEAGFDLRYGGSVDENSIGRHGLGFLNNTVPPAVIFECDRVHDYPRDVNERMGEALAKGACQVLGRDYSPQPQTTKRYDVVVAWSFDEGRGVDAAADHGPAWMLGVDNLFKVLERDELDQYDIGYVIGVGWQAQEMVNQVGDGIAVSAHTRYETWQRVLEMITEFRGVNPERARPWPTG